MTAPLPDHFPARVTEASARTSRAQAFVADLLTGRTITLLIVLVVMAQMIIGSGNNAYAQCTEEGPLQNFTGTLRVACPCFVPGEQAGSVFNLPANEYPIEILKVGIAWASQFGGAPQSIEQAIHIYGGGLPDPGTPIFTLPGPVLNDGYINEFDLEPVVGSKTIASGPFTVTLEFLNSNVNDPFAPTVLHDGNGCQSGKNVVFAVPGGWYDACVLGVTGDWVFYVKYKSLKALASANPSPLVFTSVPAHETTCDTIFVMNDGCDELTIEGISGCSDSPFTLDTTMTDHSILPGEGTKIVVCVTPTTAGTDTCTITVVSDAANGPTAIPVILDIVTGVDLPRISNAVESISVTPNPFNPSTTVRFTVLEAMRVDVAVYSVDGKQVRTLARDRLFNAGEQTLRWNGRNEQGEPVASGVYLVRVSTPLGNRVTRAVLIK
jgi:hypothetical protein